MQSLMTAKLLSMLLRMEASEVRHSMAVYDGFIVITMSNERLKGSAFDI